MLLKDWFHMGIFSTADSEGNTGKYRFRYRKDSIFPHFLPSHHVEDW